MCAFVSSRGRSMQAYPLSTALPRWHAVAAVQIESQHIFHCPLFFLLAALTSFLSDCLPALVVCHYLIYCASVLLFPVNQRKKRLQLLFIYSY